MSYQVFARKYRPKTFDDVLGQDHVVRTLRNAIAEKRLAHAYLFVGPRGTGKTSTARILAKALNCTDGPKADFDPDEELCEEIAEGRSLDVLEIDGASNNGVEQVRDLRDSVRFAPARGQFKMTGQERTTHTIIVTRRRYRREMMTHVQDGNPAMHIILRRQ